MKSYLPINKITPALTIFALLLAGNSFASSFSYDFQNDTLGEAPGSPASPSSAGEIYIVDANTTVKDPFGGEGNQSLYLKDTDGGTPRVTWQLTEAISAGELTFDMYMPNTTTEGSLTWRVYLYSGNVNNFSISVGGSRNNLTFLDDAASITNTSGIPMDQVHSFRIVLHQDQTYAIWVDGQQVSYIPGGETEAKTLFDWRGTDETLTHLQFVAGSNSGTIAQLFIDNITFTPIPEPAHFSLAAGVILLSLLFLRKRRK